ncbi:unnamed protein product [Caenorhabditis bovis]|uniref:SAM domain-containing protein n=1 Tax=Caenorhabditis bovis TaxID=2654633 RepID=A0A8S1EJI8_9PELO|nr:unnamed protein product [Caenorhabditis bovis]
MSERPSKNLEPPSRSNAGTIDQNFSTTPGVPSNSGNASSLSTSGQLISAASEQLHPNQFQEFSSRPQPMHSGQPNQQQVFVTTEQMNVQQRPQTVQTIQLMNNAQHHQNIQQPQQVQLVRYTQPHQFIQQQQQHFVQQQQNQQYIQNPAPQQYIQQRHPQQFQQVVQTQEPTRYVLHLQNEGPSPIIGNLRLVGTATTSRAAINTTQLIQQNTYRLQPQPHTVHYSRGPVQYSLVPAGHGPQETHIVAQQPNVAEFRVEPQQPQPQAVSFQNPSSAENGTPPLVPVYRNTPLTPPRAKNAIPAPRLDPPIDEAAKITKIGLDGQPKEYIPPPAQKAPEKPNTAADDEDGFADFLNEAISQEARPVKYHEINGKIIVEYNKMPSFMERYGDKLKNINNFLGLPDEAIDGLIDSLEEVDDEEEEEKVVIEEVVTEDSMDDDDVKILEEVKTENLEKKISTPSNSATSSVAKQTLANEKTRPKRTRAVTTRSKTAQLEATPPQPPPVSSGSVTQASKEKRRVSRKTKKTKEKHIKDEEDFYADSDSSIEVIPPKPTTRANKRVCSKISKSGRKGRSNSVESTPPSKKEKAVSKAKNPIRYRFRKSSPAYREKSYDTSELSDFEDDLSEHMDIKPFETSKASSSSRTSNNKRCDIDVKIEPSEPEATSKKAAASQAIAEEFFSTRRVTRRSAAAAQLALKEEDQKMLKVEEITHESAQSTPTNSTKVATRRSARMLSTRSSSTQSNSSTRTSRQNLSPHIFAVPQENDEKHVLSEDSTTESSRADSPTESAHKSSSHGQEGVSHKSAKKSSAGKEGLKTSSIKAARSPTGKYAPKSILIKDSSQVSKPKVSVSDGSPELSSHIPTSSCATSTESTLPNTVCTRSRKLSSAKTFLPTSTPKSECKEDISKAPSNTLAKDDTPVVKTKAVSDVGEQKTWKGPGLPTVQDPSLTHKDYPHVLAHVRIPRDGIKDIDDEQGRLVARITYPPNPPGVRGPLRAVVEEFYDPCDDSQPSALDDALKASLPGKQVNVAHAESDQRGIKEEKSPTIKVEEKPNIYQKYEMSPSTTIRQQGSPYTLHQKYEMLDKKPSAKELVAETASNGVELRRRKLRRVLEDICTKVGCTPENLPGGVPNKRISHFTLQDSQDWVYSITNSDAARQRVISEEIDGDTLMLVSPRELSDCLQLRFGPGKKIQMALSVLREYDEILAKL